MKYKKKYCHHIYFEARIQKRRCSEIDNEKNPISYITSKETLLVCLNAAHRNLTIYVLRPSRICLLMKNLRVKILQIFRKLWL